MLRGGLVLLDFWYALVLITGVRYNNLIVMWRKGARLTRVNIWLMIYLGPSLGV